MMFTRCPCLFQYLRQFISYIGTANVSVNSLHAMLTHVTCQLKY